MLTPLFFLKQSQTAQKAQHAQVKFSSVVLIRYEKAFGVDEPVNLAVAGIDLALKPGFPLRVALG